MRIHKIFREATGDHEWFPYYKPNSSSQEATGNELPYYKRTPFASSPRNATEGCVGFRYFVD